ncbi:MAG TPA: MFS transporter [Gaiellaceae bacterium]
MRRLLPLVCAVVVVDTMLYAALVPLLPHYQHQFGLSKGGVGALAAAYAIGTLAGGLPGGIVSSRFGARTAVLAGLALMSIASVGFAVAGSFGTLFGARLAQGLGSSLTWAGGLSWLAMTTPRERRGTAMGTAMGAAVFGALLGPVIGAVASVVGVRAAFSAVAALGVVLAAWSLRFAAAPREELSFGALPRAFRDTRFLQGLWLISLPALLFGTMSVLVPLALSSRGFGAVAIGAVWLGSAAIESAINPLLGRMTDRRGFALPVRLSLVGSIVASLALATSEWPPILVPLVLVSGLAYGGFYAPGLTLMSHSAEEVGIAQGLSFGVMNAAWAIGNAVGPAAGGGLAEITSDAVPYLAGAGICVFSMYATRNLGRERAPAVAET